MIAGHPQIDRVMEFDSVNVMQLTAERFDLLINLDKEPQPCAAAMNIHAKKKLGIGLSKEGKPVPMNRQAEHYFALGLSDELKFCHNEKSYQQLVYEAFGWKYDGQRYELPLCDQAVDRVRLSLASRGWQPGQPSVGVFVGAGKAFANKMWPAERIVEVIRVIRERNIEAQVLLLGGPGERKTIDQILRRLHDEGEMHGVIDTGTDHDEPSFVAVVDACDVLFCGDTMAMHAAIALAKGVVAFFGPTCEQEIDFFGRGEALVADVPCGPCYKRVCNENDVCVKHIAAEDAAAAVLRVLKKVKSGDVALPVRKGDEKPARPRREAA
jgi:heptosyltransferase-2